MAPISLLAICSFYMRFFCRSLFLYVFLFFCWSKWSSDGPLIFEFWTRSFAGMEIMSSLCSCDDLVHS